MLDERKNHQQFAALARLRRRDGNDSLSSANRGIHRRSFVGRTKVKEAILIGAVVAVLLALAAVSLWGPSTVPPGQTPLTTLSPANLREFSAAFDSQANLRRSG